MDISDKDFEKLVLATTEKVLLRMPEVIGNLIQHTTMCNKLNLEFYKENPSFAENKQLVVSVISELEGQYPEKSYDFILEKAKPLIAQKLNVINSVDCVTKPTNVSLSMPDEVKHNGAL